MENLRNDCLFIRFNKDCDVFLNDSLPFEGRDLKVAGMRKRNSVGSLRMNDIYGAILLPHFVLRGMSVYLLGLRLNIDFQRNLCHINSNAGV